MKTAIIFYIASEFTRGEQYFSAFYGTQGEETDVILDEMFEDRQYSMVAEFDLRGDEDEEDIFVLTQNVQDMWCETMSPDRNINNKGSRLRSSMVGDIFLLKDGTATKGYAVMPFGFKELTGEHINTLFGLTF